MADPSSNGPTNLITPNHPWASKIQWCPVDPAHALDLLYSKRALRVKTRRSQLVHVTDLVGPQGSICDLYIQFHLSGMEYSDARKMHPAMENRFDVGHGFHHAVELVLEDALHEYLLSNAHLKIELVDVQIEQQAMTPPISGTADAIVTFRAYMDSLLPDGTATQVPFTYKVVYDVKTVSKLQWDEYEKSKFVPPPTYIDQLRMYMSSVGALFGGILWIRVEKPYLKKFFAVSPNDGPLDRVKARIDSVHRAMAAGEVLGPVIGTHCADCPYRTLCTGTHENLFSLALHLNTTARGDVNDAKGPNSDAGVHQDTSGNTGVNRSRKRSQVPLG